MADPINLPVVFDDGAEHELALIMDAADQLHYRVELAGEIAGDFQFEPDMHNWTFKGELSQNEQVQVAGFIQNYTDQDWDN